MQPGSLWTGRRRRGRHTRAGSGAARGQRAAVSRMPYMSGARKTIRDVLVALWPQPRDLDLAQERGWYRVRPGVAIDRLGDLSRFGTLAFDQPDSFGNDRRRIRYRARVLGCDRLTPAALLPAEPAHGP